MAASSRMVSRRYRRGLYTALTPSREGYWPVTTSSSISKWTHSALPGWVAMTLSSSPHRWSRAFAKSARKTNETKSAETIRTEMAQGGSNIGPSRLTQQIGEAIMQGREGVCGLADPTLAGIFAPGDIAHIMDLVFTMPVAAPQPKGARSGV